jgi:hypothetical protein
MSGRTTAKLITWLGKIRNEVCFGYSAIAGSTSHERLNESALNNGGWVKITEGWNSLFQKFPVIYFKDWWELTQRCGLESPKFNASYSSLKVDHAMHIHITSLN